MFVYRYTPSYHNLIQTRKSNNVLFQLKKVFDVFVLDLKL